MSMQPSLSPRRSVATSAALRPSRTALAISGDWRPAAESPRAAPRLRDGDTQIVLSAAASRQGDVSHRILYVLGASLALATVAMIAIALTIR
jgi:hypothetical protein